MTWSCTMNFPVKLYNSLICNFFIGCITVTTASFWNSFITPVGNTVQSADIFHFPLSTSSVPWHPLFSFLSLENYLIWDICIHMNSIMQYTAFCSWLRLINIIISELLHVISSGPGAWKQDILILLYLSLNLGWVPWVLWLMFAYGKMRESNPRTAKK